jgi:hypothetical protein
MRPSQTLLAHPARVFCTLLMAGAMAACNSTPVPAIGALAVPANPDDPSGACVAAEPDNLFWSHYRHRCTQRGASCNGFGGSGCMWSSVTGGSCGKSTLYMVCEHTCEVAADCPIPATGDVAPICAAGHHGCYLPCSAGSRCPDGYQCQSTAAWGELPGRPASICMQRIDYPEITVPGGIDAGAD